MTELHRHGQPPRGDTARDNPDMPDTVGIFDRLKPFQRATVDHAFRRLWLDEDSVDKFLVADEVGLGKTLVAKGVAAKAIDHLWETKDTITIVYICSNGQIARQNLHRLRELAGGEPQQNADRLTMLPTVMGTSGDSRVNLVSLTPGTSFRLGNVTGRAEERVLLHRMLGHFMDLELLNLPSAVRYFADAVEPGRFADMLARNHNRPELDPVLISQFKQHLQKKRHPDTSSLPEIGNGTLLDLLQSELEEWRGAGSHGEIPEETQRRRRTVIGKLRMAMAEISVNRLSPDLVILDEYQRFKDIFPSVDADEQEPDDVQSLANQVITHDGTKCLILSATPYKMYTLPDEPSGEDHYTDFRDTVTFLAGKERAGRILDNLAKVRRGMLAGTSEGRESAHSANTAASAELRQIMSRTERLRETRNRDGMVRQKDLRDVELREKDLRVWMASDAIAGYLRSYDVFEFWRSASYPFSFMDRSSYQVATRLFDAADENDRELAAVLSEQKDGLFPRENVERYREVDPANPKMRWLISDAVDRGVHHLAWMPPSMPYHEPGGVFEGERTRAFTKRLIFSSWGVVPRSISTMLSYDAERRLVEATTPEDAAPSDRPDYTDGRPAHRLRYGWDQKLDRPLNLPNLTVLYPSVVLSQLADPIEVAKTSGKSLPVNTAELLAAVTERIQGKLDELDESELPKGGDATVGPGHAWYGIAPVLLDKKAGFSARDLRTGTSRDGSDDGGTSRLADHFTFAEFPITERIGPVPDNLAEVLAEMAVSGPGVCALRALSRSEGGREAITDPQVRQAAFDVARGMESLFNRPEITAVLDAQAATDATYAETDRLGYWQQVLRYCLDGNLQAVLDEYSHTLIESRGLLVEEPAQRARSLADLITATATTRTSEDLVHDLEVRHGKVRHESMRMRSHIAARFGRVQSSDSAEAREASVLDSYNSPFWPFFLASTSVGQEGLDFHTYSHSVVHWNLPNNPVDLEQREGRVHRYKGHAIRKNVADEYSSVVLESDGSDPWEAVFAAAAADQPVGSTMLKPYWVFEGDADIERYVPAMPYSREEQHYQRLRRTLSEYRSVMGQPNQQDLILSRGENDDWPVIDLSPSTGSTT